MAVSKKAKVLYNAVFEGTETKAANMIMTFQERRLLKKFITKEKVPAEYARAYKTY